MAIALIRIWVPEHVLTMTCWCRPRLDEGVVLHRRLPIRPDRQPRALVMMHEGVPA